MHRDVKPANVLLRMRTEDVLLADFGIALAQADPRITRTAVVLGSPAYMAPERRQGATGDGRADLFSLGVTLYEALEGALPFAPGIPGAAPAQSPKAMQRAGALAPLVLALLERDPARRPTARMARSMLPPRPGSTVSKTRTVEQVRVGQSVTIASKQSDIARGYAQAAGKFGGWNGLVIGALLGVVNVSDPIISLGSFKLGGGDNRWVNAIMSALMLSVLLYVVFGIMGWISGTRAKSDVITVDAHGLTVSTWRGPPEHRVAEDGTPEPPGPKIFTLRWDVLERIAVERTKQSDRPAIAVWFHPADKPSKAWRAKHAAEKREGGGFWIHRDDTNSPRAVNPERLHGPLKRFANAIYQDPHDIPDP